MTEGIWSNTKEILEMEPRIKEGLLEKISQNFENLLRLFEKYQSRLSKKDVLVTGCSIFVLLEKYD